MNTNEKRIMERESDALAAHFTTNAVKLAKATYLEEYEKCPALVAEKLQYINLYLQVMSLYTEVNELECVRELDAIYTSIYNKIMDNIEKFIAEDVDLSE